MTDNERAAKALRRAADACEAMPPQGQQETIIVLLSFHIIRMVGERHRPDETATWLELLEAELQG